MDVVWLTPVAWVGSIVLAVPIAIHLLTHGPLQRVPFPTLRFLRQTRLTAMRHRVIDDWWLLAIRLLTLAVAVAALAGPVVVLPERQERWKNRTARAVVIGPATPADAVAPLVDDERRASFESEVFRPSLRLADGLRDAMSWLDHRSSAMHEIVVAGDLRQGTIGPADLTFVPAHVGLRFLPVPAGSAPAGADVFFQEAGVRWRARTTVDDARTHVSYEREGSAAPPVTVHAAPQDAAAAQAALAAVLARGFNLATGDERRLAVVFEGGLPAAGVASPAGQPASEPLASWMRRALAELHDMRGRADSGRLVVYVPRRATGPDVARDLERVIRTVLTEDRSPYGLVPIPASALARWSRPPGERPGQAVPDAGDRRWFWTAVLALMAAETVVRRAAPRPRDLEFADDARIA